MRPVFARRSFRGRFLRHSFVLLAVALCVSLVISYVVARGVILSRFHSIHSPTMAAAVSRADRFLKEMANLLGTIAESDLLPLVSPGRPGGAALSSESAMARWTLESYFASFIKDYTFIDFILLVSERQVYIAAQSSLLGSLRVDAAGADVLRAAIEDAVRLGNAADVSLAKLAVDGIDRFVMLRSLPRAAGTDYLLIAINSSFPEAVGFPGSLAYLQRGAEFFSIGGSTPGYSDLADRLARRAWRIEEIRDGELRGSRFFLRSRLGLPGDWSVVNVVDATGLVERLARLRWQMVLAALLGCAAACAGSLAVSRHLATRILGLEQHIAGLIARGFPAADSWTIDDDRRLRMRTSLRLRIFLSLFLLVFIPVTALSVVTYLASTSLIQHQVGTGIEAHVSRAAFQVNFLCEEFEKACRTISTNVFLQERLQSRGEPGDIAERQRLVSERVIFTSLVALSDIVNIAIFDEDGEPFYSLVWSEDPVQLAEWREDAATVRAANPRKLWRGILFDHLERRFIRIGMRIRRIQDASPLGYLFLDFNADAITAILQAMAVNTRARLLLYDDARDVVYSSPEAMPSGEADRLVQSADALRDGASPPADRRTTILTDTVRLPAWSIVAFVPRSEYLRANNPIILANGLLLVAYGLGILLSTLRVSRSVVAGLRELSDAMRDFNDGIHAPVPMTGSNDEIERLQASFNTMVQKLRTLIREVYQAQIDRGALELRLKESQFAALRAQINPHFLNNTLETIHYMIVVNDQRAIRMVQLLGDLFRVGIGDGAKVIRLEQELAHVRLYLEIQKVRYSDRFSCTIQVDEEIARLYTIAFVVQPIVENAIYHGLELREEGGTIGITAETRDDELLIHVSDNGCGMDEATLSRIYESLDAGSAGGHVGMTNVHERIRLNFGDRYGLRILSVRDQGTRVTLVLPLLREPPPDGPAALPVSTLLRKPKK